MFLKSISYWSFPGGLENTADYAGVFAKAKAAGYDAVEAAVAETGVLTPSSTEADCKAIVAAAAKAGIKIASLATGVYWGASLTATDPAIRDKAVDYTKKMLQIARWLGTDTLLVVPGAVNVFFNPQSEIVSYDDVYKRSVASIKQCLPTAKKVEVAMAVENVWNKFLLSPLEMKAFVDGFKSPFVGVYYDTGNTVVTGFPEQWIKILGNRIKRIHLKDFKWRFLGNCNEVPGFKDFAAGQAWGTMAAFCDLGAGDVNWPAVMSALKAVGYSGPLTAEMLPPDPTIVERTSKAIDKILALGK
jgi:hexulose-6-phosphate isomerase